MGSATALAPGLSRKLKKVLETRTDSAELLSSLNTLSNFYTENTPQSRRNLRSTIEKRGLSINQEFLLASLAAQQALDRVEEEVNSLAECCDKIASALSTCNATTGDIISTTERLKQDLEITTQRQEIVSCFLRDYQLSNEEINALRDEDLNENFFKALAHVQEIHANCKVLLRTHHQRAGLELMDMMAVYQEGAFERLCRWVQADSISLKPSRKLCSILVLMMPMKTREWLTSQWTFLITPRSTFSTWMSLYNCDPLYPFLLSVKPKSQNFPIPLLFFSSSTPFLTRMITIAKLPPHPPNRIPRTLFTPRFSGKTVVSFNLGFGSEPRKKPGFFGLIWADYESGGMELLKKLSRGCFSDRTKKGQKVQVESDNGGEDYFDAATAETKVQPQHLVVMVNGLAGSAADWRYAAEQFVKRLPDKIIVHRSECNTSKLTFDGVDLMGERLAEEVVSVVKNWPGLHKISFVAHSLGGLIARYAIGRLYELSAKLGTAEQAESSSGGETNISGKCYESKIAGLEPMNFITFATPHLGSRGHKQLPLLCGLPFLERSASQTAHWIAGRSGKHLFLTDNDNGKPPLLLRMVDDSDDLKFMSALRSFKRRVAYANANYDHVVGWRTSSIRRQHELPKPNLLLKNEKYPHIVHVDQGNSEGNNGKALSIVGTEIIDLEEEMIRGLTKVPWERIDVSFRKSTQRYVAHNTIQVNRYWMNSDGADVVQHMIDNFIV